MVKREDTSTSTMIDTFGYNWDNQLIFYHKGTDSLKFAYNASGLRVMKKCFEETEVGDGGGLGMMFEDASDDLGIKSKNADSTYNKGRDIDKIYVKTDANYYTFTITCPHLFSESGKLELFLTLDVDTTENSGNISYPEDKLTKVPGKAAWEFCVYVTDEDYGFYKKNGTKISKPFGMGVEKVTGDSGSVKIKVSKTLISNPSVIRFTAATFDPNKTTNNNALLQGGSTAADVFPGSPSSFGGEITGFGQINPLGSMITQTTTIFYLYGNGGIEPTIEYSPNGSLLNRYIYGNGMHLCRLAQADVDTFYYHCDALGSPRVMTDERGAIKWQAWYWPFGEMTESGFTDNPHGFTGKEWDDEIGFDLNYFCQRYYDPKIGRFLALDPQDSPAYSPYAYCANSPLRYVDPNGAVIREIDRQNSLVGQAMQIHAGWKAGGGALYNGSTAGFGSWAGSMASWMAANPAFHLAVAYNEWQSAMRMFFQKNNYFRETTENGYQRTTTEYFFNSVANTIGSITTTETFAREFAHSLLNVANLLVDATYDWGESTIMDCEKAVLADIMDKPGLIVDEIFWGVVAVGLKTKISGQFPVGVRMGVHTIPHGEMGTHLQINVWLNGIPKSGLPPIRIPWPF